MIEIQWPAWYHKARWSVKETLYRQPCMIRNENMRYRCYAFDYGVHSQALFPWYAFLICTFTSKIIHKCHIHVLQCYKLHSKRFLQKYVFPLFHPILCQHSRLTRQEATRPVSYTHLDVYKRQRITWRVNFPTAEWQIIFKKHTSTVQFLMRNHHFRNSC